LKIIDTEIPDVKLIELNPFVDHRGFFVKIYNQKTFEESFGCHHFFECDISGSYHNILRGLHYQSNNPQGKFITVLQGEIFDVAVDIRKSSPTFGKWISVILSGAKKQQIWIPPGFAHGFYTLSPWAEILYMTSQYYDPSSDSTILWNDQDIGIEWPIPEGVVPTISKKDMGGKSLKDAICFE
jgi:dTDP-4-dehydrorhamnose 3,5-epimerase